MITFIPKLQQELAFELLLHLQVSPFSPFVPKENLAQSLGPGRPPRQTTLNATPPEGKTRMFTKVSRALFLSGAIAVGCCLTTTGPQAAFAQGITTGGLSGSVTDASGA